MHVCIVTLKSLYTQIVEITRSSDETAQQGFSFCKSGKQTLVIGEKERGKVFDSVNGKRHKSRIGKGHSVR